ncbi:MAG: hypothetical protein AB7U79_06395 [Candidatus Izemoplasmatales bacterium]
MLFNMISLLGLIFSFFVLVAIYKSNRGEKILKLFSALLVIYKTIEYVIINIHGQYTFPIEISTISYFMFAFILFSNKEKYYHIASFFGILSGTGFFFYYSIFGFVSEPFIGTYQHIVATIGHGILFVGGFYLFFKYPFSSQFKYQIYLVLLAIMCHAAIFQTPDYLNRTLIMFIINPYFLSFSDYLWMNHLLWIIYYLLLFMIFNRFTKWFYAFSETLKDFQQDAQLHY